MVEKILQAEVVTSKKKVYSQKTIYNALMIHSVSPKVYKMIRENKLTYDALPSRCTLSRRISHIKCFPGVQSEFLHFVKLNLSTADFWQRQSVLMFDEIDLCEKFDYCKRLKKVFGKYKKAQVVMLRKNFQ